MEELEPITDDELDKIAENLECGRFGQWEMRRLIMACRTHRRVLRHLFDLFVSCDDSDSRTATDSIRTSNLIALKKEVGMDDPK